MWLHAVCSWLLAAGAAIWSSQVRVPTSNGDDLDWYISEERQAWLNDLFIRWDIPQYAMKLVGRRDDGSWHEETFTWGNRTVDGEVGEPLDESKAGVIGLLGRFKTHQTQHLWAIASNSKLFVALAMSMLIEDSQRPNSTIMPLSWQTRLMDVLGEGFVVQDKYAQEHLTIEDLTCTWFLSSLGSDCVDMTAMQSGIPQNDRSEQYNLISDLEKQLPGIPFTTEPRQRFQYSNYGYNLLALVFHRLIGTTNDSSEAFTSYVQKRIFEPANLTTASHDMEAARRTGLRVEGQLRNGFSNENCQAYLQGLGLEEWTRRGRPVPRPLCTGEPVGMGAWTDLGTKSWAPCAGVSMTLDDLGQWMKLLLDPPDWLKPHLEEASTARVYQAPPHRSSLSHIMSDTLYGKGTFIEWYRGNLVHQHSGGMLSQKSMLLRLPHRELAIYATVGEESHVGMYIAPLYAILDDILGVPETERWDYEAEFLFNPFFPPVTSSLPAKVIKMPAASLIEGIYDNVAYGRRQIQRDDSQSMLRFDFASDHPSGINTSAIFVAETNNLFKSHWIFTPFSGSIFNWTEILVYPREVTYYNETTAEWQQGRVGGKEVAVDIGYTGAAVFTEAGLGMFGITNWGGQATWDIDRSWESGSGQALVDAVKGKAEVWFDRK